MFLGVKSFKSLLEFKWRIGVMLGFKSFKPFKF
jgi:hypothetical protein